MESKIKLDTEPDEETELLNFKSELKKRTEKAEQILQKDRKSTRLNSSH